MSQSQEITLIQTGLASMDRVAAGIAELTTKYRGVIYEVVTSEGMEAAREARRAIKAPRVEVEKIRKEAKAPILELGRKLDAEAARITGELEKLENPIDAQIKVEEKRIEAERQAKIAAEVKRVADIHARIRDMSNGITLLCATTHLSVLQKWIDETEAIAIDDSFAEFRGNAEIEKADVLRRLRELYVAAKAHQDAEDALRAEQARLAAERAEQEERNRVERERIAAEDAERRRVADLDEANRREIARATQAAIDTANAAESERLAAQALALADAQRELDAEREKLAPPVVTPPVAEKPAECPYQFASFPRPTFEQIVFCVGERWNVSDEQVRTWIQPVPESER